MPKNEPARKAAYKVCRRFGIPSSAKHSEIVKIIEEYTYEVFRLTRCGLTPVGLVR